MSKTLSYRQTAPLDRMLARLWDGLGRSLARFEDAERTLTPENRYAREKFVDDLLRQQKSLACGEEDAL